MNTTSGQRKITLTEERGTGACQILGVECEEVIRLL